jgi:hypothetical protein
MPRPRWLSFAELSVWSRTEGRRGLSRRALLDQVRRIDAARLDRGAKSMMRRRHARGGGWEVCLDCLMRELERDPDYEDERRSMEDWRVRRLERIGDSGRDRLKAHDKLLAEHGRRLDGHDVDIGRQAQTIESLRVAAEHHTKAEQAILQAIRSMTG